MHKLIFLAEDDPDDAMLFREALQKVNPACELVTVLNGREALNKLMQHPHRAPDVIVLDINMPGIDGLECLTEIRKVSALQYTPVVILSTSNDSHTIHRAYAAGASFFATKPHSFQQLIEMVGIVVRQEWPIRPQQHPGI